MLSRDFVKVAITASCFRFNRIMRSTSQRSFCLNPAWIHRQHLAYRGQAYIPQSRIEVSDHSIPTQIRHQELDTCQYGAPASRRSSYKHVWKYGVIRPRCGSWRPAGRNEQMQSHWRQADRQRLGKIKSCLTYWERERIETTAYSIQNRMM